MKKIITLLVSAVMILTLSVCVSATAVNTDGSYILDLIPSKTEVSVGETYTISVYIRDAGDKNATIDFPGGFGNFIFKLSHNETFATWNKTSSTFNFGLTSSAFSIQSGNIYGEAAVEGGDIIVGYNNPLFVLSFEATAPGEINYDALDYGVADAVDFNELSYFMENTTVNTATVTIKAAEEEFEPTYEGFVEEDGGETVTTGFEAGSKVATVFAKAEEELAAGTYGIIFGGQTYVGAAKVDAGKYWVIRLYDPSGNILTGSEYDCQKFVGEAVEAADYKLETK